jgi:hypothetical protein
MSQAARGGGNIRSVRVASLGCLLGLVSCADLLGADFGDRRLDPAGSSSTSSSGGMGGSAVGGGGAGGQGGDGGVGGGGSPPTECWGSDPTEPGAWEITPMDWSALAGTGHTDPMLSANGLTLTYVALNSSGRLRAFQAMRASRADPFVGGTELGSWGSDPSLYAHAWVLGDELFLTDETPPAVWNIVRSVRTMATWAPPQPLLAGPANFADAAATEGGLALFFTSYDGAMTPVGNALRLSRSARPTPADAFATPAPVALPGVDDADFVITPAPSPDGHHLFLASTHETAVLDTMNICTAAKVYLTERATTAAPWGPLVHIPALDGVVGNAGTDVVTADGCEVWFHEWDSCGTNFVAFKIARRTPR